MANRPPRIKAADFSGAALADLEKYASDRDITIEEAATQLAKLELTARFGRPMKAGARVVPFRRH